MWPGRHPRLALIALAVAVVAAAWGGWRCFSHPRIDGIRNVVLISIDTCRADHLSCYGYKRPTTPNVDAVARDGVQFQLALTPVPLTTPAHSTMLTGTYPPTHGVRLNNGERLADSNVTLAEILRDAGYQTAAFVGGFPMDASFGLNQGFDTYDCQFTTKNEKSPFAGERTAEEVSRPALAWLEAHSGKPFFLFLHYYDPHLPYAPPPPYASAYADDPYAGEIAYVDHWIGQVLDRLRALGVYDNTLVIITADHGEGLGERGENAHGVFLYQNTVQVPLVIRAPKASNGRQVDGNVSLVDIVPTVLDLAGLKTPPQVEGVTLRRSLESGPMPDTLRPIYCESLEAASFGCSPLNGVVEGPWKYIRAPRQELYDLKRDSGEQDNVIAKEPQVAGRLRGRLEAMLQEMESAAPQRGPSTVDPEAVRRLQSLGYVGGGATPATSEFDPRLEDPKDFLPTYERLQKAHSLFLANHGEEATKELLELVASRPGLITPHAMLAQIAVSERRLADAAGHCAKIVSILTESKDFSKQLPPAAEDLASGKLDTRDLATAHFNLAVVLKGVGKSSEAIGHFEKALRIRPDSAEAHFNLGVVLQHTGKLPEAIGHYEDAVRIKPDYADAHMNLGSILQQTGKLPEAIGHYEQAVRIKPDYADAHYNLGLALEQAGKLPEAIGHFEQALRINPQFALAANRLGSALIQQGRIDEAIATLEKVLKASPEDVDAHYRLGTALRRQGKFAEALAHWREGLRLRPDNIILLNDTACLLATSPEASIRNGKEAVELAKKCVELSGGKVPEFLDTLAAAYAEAGQFPEAVKTAEEALALATSQKKAALVDDLGARIKLYKSGSAFHETKKE